MNASELPLVLAGPILRRLTAQRVTLWLAVREPVRARLTLTCGEASPRSYALEPGTAAFRSLTAGEQLHYLLIELALDAALPYDRWIGYTLALQPLSGEEKGWQDSSEWAPDLCYPGKSSPGFLLPSRVAAVLHGSCRKPHFPGRDGLVQADHLLARCLAADDASHDTTQLAQVSDTELPAWPSALVLTGDQIYTDDVAGPMLRAIHQLIARLGLPVEALSGAGETGLTDSDALYRHPAGYYHREKLLPRRRRNYALIEMFFGGVEKPVFTTDSAHNHLITLAEVLAMYLLAWSPAPWAGIDLEPPPGLDAASRARYAREGPAIEAFITELASVRRLFAHLPVAMIFDDHDITDDWNLSREWEEVAYDHPFSNRVIGNALIAYLLNQGWGNDTAAFDDELLEQLQRSLSTPGSDAHAACIERLLRFDHWHYSW
ncbi:MAG: alkaline phosphatase family protein, partial [Sedimenticolaceae bacterium]